MLRPVLILAAVGVTGVVAWKILWVLLLPLLGAILGFAWTALKILLFILVAYWLYRVLFKGPKKKVEVESE